MQTRLFFAVIFCSLLTACSQQTIKPALNDELVKDRDKRALGSLVEDKRSDELTLILTLSGGGTRAAAFSYGVMQELRNMPINADGRSLLDEVDIISSVSGGSFTAAYYGLYGDRMFVDYESRFLKRPVQTRLLRTLMSPSNWFRLGQRSNIAANYYESTIFDKKRFIDMRRDAPGIVINATDLATGQAFSFSDPYFKSICSRLETYSVGRAVVASSAVPVVFSPITLKNYDKECKFLRYRDRSEFRPYLHLVDGGVVDNLGIRSLLTVVSQHNGNFWEMMKAYGMTNNHKVAFIVVNSSDAIPPQIGKSARSPDPSAVLGAVTTIQFGHSNRAILNTLRSRFPEWQLQIAEGRCAEQKTPDCAKIDFYMAELNFKQLPKELAKELSLIETSLQLPPAKVEKLINAGRDVLRKSPEVKHLINSF